MLLTLAVWVLLYVRRIRWMVAERIRPQSVATPDRLASIVPDAVNTPSHNLRNLVELPLLFYVLCLYLYVTAAVDTAYVAAAWVFAAFRIAHSAVHCTSNRVMLRFRLYMIASLALWFMLLRAVAQWLAI